ncbi:glycosyltransferase family 4 protein [Geodermatophilus marinus]|uniref:glycosyltransferase family 4 protein n=1 Tax=Geodermatophilus sp. LHW52908 TaxID=2303986 RepID=UPI000E3D17A0|nr:glycosyltransferase family 4 protein [Geodermatophilus sp. LHW52908]RFU21760.1 glycosyltransferase [Geodermatophilus sp. LHW52908]
MSTVGAVDRAGRVAVVPARFGPEIVGGAEIVLRHIAQGLQGRGWDVEVLTTAATDYFSWTNDQPVGCRVEDGLTVRRFEAVKSTPGTERSDLGHRMLAGDRLTLTEQERWINDDVRVPGLYHHLLLHAERYRALVFGPYLFWPSYACSQVAPERSLLWTCLHDEPAAYQEIYRPLLSGVAGLFLQTEPEHDLAHRLFPQLAPHAVVGCGVEVPSGYDPEAFRARYGITRPYVLYAGRREGAKGWDELLQHFRTAVLGRGLDLALVTMGAGEVRPPQGLEDRVVDVGFLPDDERDDAYAGALAYVQPSRYEAFSRTIMESWLAGRPVVGIGEGGVVRHHVETSRGGLLYDDAPEFAESLAVLLGHPRIADEMGRRGREYVLSRYQWDTVLDGIERSIVDWTPPPTGAAGGAPPVADRVGAARTGGGA